MSRRLWLHGVLAEARVTSCADFCRCEFWGLRLRWLCQIVRVGFTGTFLHEFKQLSCVMLLDVPRGAISQGKSA